MAKAIKLNQVKKAPEIAKDVEILKEAGLTKDLVFVMPTAKLDDRSTEIFFPYNGTCTDIVATVGSVNMRDETPGAGDITIELQRWEDSVWNVITSFTIVSGKNIKDMHNLTYPITKSSMRLKITGASEKFADLTVVMIVAVGQE